MYKTVVYQGLPAEGVRARSRSPYGNPKIMHRILPKAVSRFGLKGCTESLQQACIFPKTDPEY